MPAQIAEIEMLPKAPTMEPILDGSEKNFSLVKPESLIERSFIKTTPEQRAHAYDRESLWLEQKRGDLKTNENPTTEKDQLNLKMDQIMVKLVEANIKYGTHSFQMGNGETSAVLLLTPVKTLGEKRPDPTGYDIEEYQDVDAEYVDEVPTIDFFDKTAKNLLILRFRRLWCMGVMMFSHLIH